MQDLRLAVRSLRATPIVTAVAILSLALGMGANTAIFSLVNSLLLRSLPVADPQRLVTVTTGPSLYEQQDSYATFDQIRQHGEPFDGVLAWASLGKVTLRYHGETQTADDAFVSGDYFTTLGVPALLGRTLTPADDVRGGGPDGPVTVISYGLWQQRFGGAASVIGTRITIERASVTIVGVTPPGFFGVEVGRAFDVALCTRTFELIRPAVKLDDDGVWLRIIARLKRGESLEAATAALRAAQPAIRAGAMPRQIQDAASFLKEPLRLEPAGAGVSPLRQRFEQPLVMILVVVAVVLLIACANIANLLLARGTARQHELSVRLALGASRWRLACYCLMEGVVLTVMATIVGLVLAMWASRAIVAQLSTAVRPVALTLPLDWRVLAFTSATLIATVLLFGIAPILRATRIAPIEALKAHGRTAAGHAHHRLSNGLVVAQVALSVTVVVAAGLFVRTFDRLAHVSLGFDRDRVLVVTLSAPTVPAADRNLFYHHLVSAVAGVPGVADAGGSMSPPLTSNVADQLLVTVPGAPPRAEADRRSRSNYMTPGFLAAYGTRIRAGRDVDDHDTLATLPVMVVNDAFVRRFLPNQNPIGTTVAVSARYGALSEIPMGSKTIVGVASDAVYSSIREPAPPTMYFPLAQQDAPIAITNFYIAVRSSVASPVLLTRSLAAALMAVNADLNLAFRPLSEQVNESLAQDRLVAVLSGCFGALALLLAGLGLYGVTAYAVTQRRTEIGIRMALGSTPAGVMRLVLARVSMLVGLGVLIGGGVSLWASTLVASLLYGIDPRDPLTLAGAAITLAMIGVLAGGVPAYRASHMAPVDVLRES